MQTILETRDFNQYPKFRHNLWTSYYDNPSVMILTVSHGDYEVSVQEANEFIKMRPHCTGFNTKSDIANKSGLKTEEVNKILTSLKDAEILHLPFVDLDKVSDQQIQDTLLAATRIWGEQLAETSISRDIFLGRTSKQVILGWLLETYHYVKDFPNTLEVALYASEGKLSEILNNYMLQERGHEKFIAECLIKGGLTKEEIEESIPLISTRTISFLLKELFQFEPISVLLVASIIEADEFSEEDSYEVTKKIALDNSFPEDIFAPFLKHVEIDNQMGHQKLLENNIEILKLIDKNKLHQIVNMLHDLKHAFDLQKLEIYEYYDKSGNYFPRQKVDFFAI